MLARRRVLVAEDDGLIALDLATAIEDAGGEVAGPVASVKEGLNVLADHDVDAAILDVRLLDRDVAPLAHLLLGRGKAVVFHTASAIPAEIIERHGEVVVCSKPAPSEHVVVRLAALISRGRDGRSSPV